MNADALAPFGCEARCMDGPQDVADGAGVITAPRSLTVSGGSADGSKLQAGRSLLEGPPGWNRKVIQAR